MSNKLEFRWREGDLGLHACPERLVRFSEDEENTTINFVAYRRHEDGTEFLYSIGYFKYNHHNDYWGLTLVGDRFKDIPPEQSAALWEKLGEAYDVLNDWLTVNRV